MSRIIAVVNQKGGVGKTTTAVNLAAYLANLGKWVLLVDIDPQGNATSGFGIDHANNKLSIYDSIINGRSIREVIQESPVLGCRVIPSNINLAGATVELVNLAEREFRLKNALVEVENSYDYIIIDCPPSLGLLTINGLVAAREVLIPVQCEYYALEGLAQLLSTINLVRDNLKPSLEILGAVLTMFDSRNKLSRDVFEEIYKYFPKKVFRAVIPRATRLAEAPSFGKPICLYDPSSKGAKAYERLAREIMLILPQSPVTNYQLPITK